jgi:butyryl-CoA dehydrogenase
MDFELTEDQKLIIKTTKEICERELIPAEEGFPEENIKTLGRSDLFGIPIPEEYGGLGQDFLTWALVGEEISYRCTTTGAIFGAHMLCMYPILRFGSEELKRRYLTPLAKGETIGAFALTEPGAGSDASAIKTSAKKEGEEYVIDGTKIFITNGGRADIYVILAKTSPERGARGMSAFVIEKGRPGFTFGKNEEKMAYPGLPNVELIFSGCRVSAKNLLGREGRGFRVAMETLDVGRIGMGAGAVGLARAAYDEAVRYSKERVQFGAPISTFQAIQFMLADMATEIQAARLLTMNAAYLKDKERPFTHLAAMAKLYASEVAMRVVNKAVQIHGGYGYTKDYKVERYFREAKLFEIVEGTSEIQRMVIANHILK